MTEANASSERPTVGDVEVGRARVLVARSGALGDFVLTLPALGALRAGLPAAELVYAGRSEFGAFARAAGVVDRILDEDAPEFVSLFQPWADLSAFARKVGAISIAVSFLDSDVVTASLLRSGAGEVWAVAARPAPGGRVHAADHLAGALRPRFDVPLPAIPHARVPADTRDHAREALRAQGVAPGAFLAVHPGSGSPLKNWPAECFARVSQGIVERLGLPTVIISGPAEREGSGPIRAALGACAAAWFESPRLPLLGAILAESAAYLGNDSGVTHLAAASGARTIAVFGPSDPEVWAPRGPNVRVLVDPSRATGSVAPERVVQAIVELVEERAGRSTRYAAP